MLGNKNDNVEHGFKNNSDVNVGMITFVEIVKTVANLNGVSTCEWNRNVCLRTKS